MKVDWKILLQEESEKEYWHELQEFIQKERVACQVYPEPQEVFHSFRLTPLEEVKVLILGQDPYHGVGQAHGLSFSVKSGVPIPPSLRNIFKELESDLGIPPPMHGELTSWAKQGVLLLNAALTVRENEAGSHQGRGWEIFTDEVIRTINQKSERVVFILWGALARKKRALINLDKHIIVESPHPSPLSAYKGFWGSRPFSRTNKALSEVGLKPVNWNL